MSDITASSAAAGKPLGAPRPWVLVLGVWALMTLISVQQTAPTLFGAGPADTDVLVRLQHVRDLLAGQGWYDGTQHRLGAPHGVALHWTRVVDLPIAALILLFSGVFERATAELIAMAVWPALLGLGFLAAIVSIATRLGGPLAALPAAFLALFALHARYLFSAGNIDHHNIQLALALGMVAALVRLDLGARAGALGGLAAALMLAIGLETLPLIALAGAAAALGLALDPKRFAAGATGFGLAFAGGSLAFWAAFVPTPTPGAPVCDILSPAYLAPAVIGGLGLAASALFAPRLSPTARWGALAVTGAGAVGAVLLIAPHCLKGPYGELSAELVTRWLSSVDEAQSWRELLGNDAAKAISIAGGPLVGLILGLWLLVRAPREDRFGHAVALTALALCVAVMALQIRGGAFAAAFALPAASAAIAIIRARANDAPKAVAPQLLLVLAWVLPQGFLWEGIGRGAAAAGLLKPPAALASHAPASGEPAPPVTICFDRREWGAVAALSAGGVLAPSNLGPALLAYTPHSAIAGPYHRDQAGILASIDAFEGTATQARETMRARRLAYVAHCLGDSSLPGIAQDKPVSFAADLLAQRRPEWLEPVVTTGPIRVYRLR